MEAPVPQGTDRPAGQFEFDSKQNQVIGDLASEMRWVAAPFMVLGALYGLATVLGIVQLFQNPAALVAVIFIGMIALLLWMLGSWTRRAAESFQEIVTTGGRDVGHLMEALDNLRKMYTVLSTFVKVYVALTIVGLIAALIMLIASALRG